MTSRLLLAVLLFALVGGGCGSSGTDTLALLDTAAEKAHDESYRATYSVESTIQGQEISMKGSGSSSADGTRGRMKVAIGDQRAFEGIVIGGVMYLKADGPEFGLPAGKRWLRTKHESIGAPSLSPSQFVRFLRESGDVRVVGTDAIRGDKTTHFSGPLNLEKLADETGRRAVEQLGAIAKDADVALDVWVAPDGLPSRIAAEITMPGKTSGSLRLAADILEYGVPVDAHEPPAAQVADESEVSG